jgi:hypothetical protein
MARRDLSELEIAELRLYARKLPDQMVKDRIERLCGEVLELRNREAHARQMHDLEGEY